MTTASTIEHIGTDRETERELYVVELANPDDVPRTFDTAGKYSTVLIVWDATDVAADTISRFARHLIDTGGVYFCTWGPEQTSLRRRRGLLQTKLMLQ